jgi:hypothetical protein
VAFTPKIPNNILPQGEHANHIFDDTTRASAYFCIDLLLQPSKFQYIAFLPIGTALEAQKMTGFKPWH